jgi:Leucine-rich repeat (LRR) protein
MSTYLSTKTYWGFSKWYDFFEENPTHTTKVLRLDGIGIHQLPQLLDYKNLEELHIENNKLVYLPPFPPSLKRLYCSNNLLKSLPEGLEVLDCSNNPDLATVPFCNLDLIINFDNTAIDLGVCRGMTPILYNNLIKKL